LRRQILIIAVVIICTGSQGQAADLRAGMFSYDGGAALYEMKNGQNLICDDCPKLAHLQAAPPAILFPPAVPAVPYPVLVVEREVEPKGCLAEPKIKPHGVAAPLVTVHFKFDSTLLAKAEKKELKKAVTGRTPIVVRVAGYACHIGPNKYNRALSLRRAKIVASYLKHQGATVSTIVGNGSSKPLGGHLSGDRRAEIWIEED
jgi:outer membrane protein OmpA-like peptidoglycan-associated protein